MKKSILTIVFLFLISCSTSKKSFVQKPLFEVLTEQIDGGASIRFFEIVTELDEIKMLQNDPLLKNKIKVEDIQNSNFIILNSGEKNSEGYKFEIESAVETDKNIIITIKEISPEPNKKELQVYTNPYCVVKINSKKEIIIK
jgi:hypothetical protein